jgi:hypothetical protein
MTTVVSYEFYFTAEGQPWFYTYTTTIIDESNNKVVFGEGLNGSDPLEFERLRKDAIDQGFPLDFAYTNSTTKVRGETYRKFWE